jgi:multidrug resistance efflux pump
VIQNANAHHAERREAIARAERAEAELDGIRALADRRNERDHSQDTTHQLVAALDQALDIAQAELATERARLDWLMAGRVVLVPNGSGHYVSRLHYPVSRAAIDAAMKEETK